MYDSVHGASPLPNRHFRFLLRLMSARMVLYTEMVAAATLYHNPESRHRHLCLSGEVEHPVVLQLGGADPGQLAEACRVALPYKYDEINLNCGCPSDKVAGNGRFGAALMREPQLVATLCREMGQAAEGTPITVKCRIGG
jgi:tRNA-dihydrouridine synthase A